MPFAINLFGIALFYKTFRGFPLSESRKCDFLADYFNGFLTGFFEADEFSPGVQFGGCAIRGIDGGYGAVFLGYAT